MLGVWKDLAQNKKVLWGLAKNDYKSRFASAGLGAAWAFLQPLLSIMVMWLVFQVGFRSAPVNNVPFMVWYIPAFLAWTFFSDALSQGTSSLLDYSYLLKKVNFQSVIIPPIKIISCSIIHMFFIAFIVIVNLLYGRMPTLYWFQVFYYYFGMVAFLMGVTWLLSSLDVFVKDVANLIAVILQVGFWATPLFWDPSSMNKTVQVILQINPMYYICMGYRESFVYDIAFWNHPVQTFYFWGVTIFFWFVGGKTFVKLKPQFVDVI